MTCSETIFLGIDLGTLQCAMEPDHSGDWHLVRISPEQVVTWVPLQIKYLDMPGPM